MKFIRTPFANNGDKDPVPQTDPSGNVNWDLGYPISYSKDPAVDPTAKRIEREMFNEIFNFLSSGLRELQVTGVAPFIPAADNGGVAYPYGLGAIVNYLDVPYISLKANNTSLPTVVADWSPLASNAFVQDMIGNYSDTTLLTSSQTLTPQQAGMVFGLGTVGISITVPDLGLVPNGATYTFKNLVNGNVTILPPAGGTFYVSDQTVSSITLARGEAVTLVGAATVYGAIITRNPGSMSSSMVVSANTTLTNGDIGKIISLTGSSAINLTLPSGSTVPTGATLEIFSSVTPGAVNVICPGGDVISVGTSTTSSISLLAGNSLRLIWGGAAWIAAGYMFGATAPQFTSDKKLATTEFVQKALGNKSNFYNFTSNTTLTAAHAGGEIWVSAPGLTLTLPAAGSVPAATELYFYGNSGGMTLSRQGSDNIINGELGASSTFLIPVQGRLGIVSNGSNAWYIVDGSSALPGSSEFRASLGAVGYQKLPGKFVLQWGAANPVGGFATITFPLAFSARPYYLGFGYREANSPTAMQSIVIDDPTLTATQVTVRAMILSGGVSSNSNSAFFWFAIGAL